MNNDLISIIVPVYNTSKFLSKCLNSIKKQSYQNIEVLIINDGSTDNSGKICEEFVALDERFKLINKPNGGLSSARNTGINLAKGKYIGFVDSDDSINNEMYKVLYQNALTYNADISICSFYEEYPNGMTKRYEKEKPIEIFNNRTALKLILEDDKLHSFAWNKLFKIELFSDLRFPEGRIFEDTAFTYLLFEKANKTVKCTEPLYYYFINPLSLSRNFNIKKDIDNFLAFNERYKFILENKMDEIADRCAIKTAKLGLNAIDQSLQLSNLTKQQHKEILDVISQVKNIKKSILLKGFVLIDKVKIVLIHLDYKLYFKLYRKLKVKK